MFIWVNHGLSSMTKLLTVQWSFNADADEMKSQALLNAQRAFDDQEARVCCN